MTDISNFREPSDRLASSEADHRITNSLSAISSLVRMQANHASVDDVRQFLLDVAGRIDTVARLHRLLAYATCAGVPMADFLRDVCTAMKDIAGGDGQFKMAIDCPETLALVPESALRVGLLTAELFSNSVKYAHPSGISTSIAVSCRVDHGMVVFSFEDDGIGFPENFDPASNESLGMKILQSLSRQLHGSCEWEDLGIGLRFTCRFPAPTPSGERPGGNLRCRPASVRDGNSVNPDYEREVR